MEFKFQKTVKDINKNSVRHLALHQIGKKSSAPHSIGHWAKPSFKKASWFAQEFLPDGVNGSGVIPRVHKSVRFDPHRQPVQVGDTLDHIHSHGGHFGTFHRERQQT